MTTTAVRPLGRVPALILAAATVCALLLLASRASFVPLWDGRIYADCAANAATGGFRPYYLRCGLHSSIAYVVLVGMAYLVMPGTPLAFHIVHAAMFGAGAVAMYRLLRFAFPSPALGIERALVAAAFLVQPSFLAMVIQPNLDLPVLVGMLWCIVTLLERRWVWTILIATLAIFSKETSVLLYGLLGAVYGLWVLVREPGSLGRRVRALVPLLPLAIPLAAFGAYVAAFLVLRPTVDVLWSSYTPDGSMARQFLVPRVNAVTHSNTLMILVLNFSWIPAAFIVADGAVGAARLVRRLPRREVLGADQTAVAFITILAVVFTYFLTRFATFSNVRYVAVAIALISIVFLAAILRLQIPAILRRAVLGAYAALLLASCLRTIDPVSRAVFGTFSAGSNEMLDLTRLTGECCQTYGRDQLAYSLEFTVFNDLVDAGLDAVAATDSTVIVIPFHADWFLIGPIDPVSKRRTLRQSAVVHPKVVEVTSLMKGEVPLPATAWYFALPNNEAATDLKMLSARYDIGAGQQLWRGGYAMSVYPLALRSP